MSSKVFRLLRAVSISTFSFFLMVGTSPHLVLHNPWLAESSGADQQSSIHGEVHFIYYLSSYYLAPALGEFRPAQIPYSSGEIREKNLA